MDGNEIRKIRADLGLTQEKFASLIGVSWSSVTRWENGFSRPSPMAINRIRDIQKGIR